MSSAIKKITMCNREICLNSTVDSTNSSEDIYDSNPDFLSQLSHCKCKVIGLVRQQMQRVAQERKVNSKCKYSPPDLESHYPPAEPMRSVSIDQGVQTHKQAPKKLTDNETSTSPLNTSIFPSFSLPRPNLPQLEHVYEYKNVIVASLVMLGVVWMALVLGALLGASVCGDKRTCLPVFQLGSALRSKHSIF